MAEITAPRLESISDPGSHPQDQAGQKPRAKAAAAGKPAPPRAPEINSSEEEKHELDEMA